MIEARVIALRDNAEFVLFSFAWVKPALGHGGRVICPRDRGLPWTVSISDFISSFDIL